MSATQTIRMDASTTDGDLRVFAESIGLGGYLTTTRTGFRRRVLMFDQGLIERRRKSVSISFDGLDRPEVELQTSVPHIYSAAS